MQRHEMAQLESRLQITSSLQLQLDEFRRRTWFVKMASGVSLAVFGLFVAFLFMFGMDRLWDTPPAARMALFASAAATLMAIPVVAYRWIWRYRRWEQLSLLLARRFPSIGDQLLGIIELSRNEVEQSRSRALCAAAISQVSRDASAKNFKDAIPRSFYRIWCAAAGVTGLIALGIFGFAPNAAANAWQRLLTPWSPIERFTFVSMHELPPELIVAHGEPFSLTAELEPTTRWAPSWGEATLASRTPVRSERANNEYVFSFPAQIEPSNIHIYIGDFRHKIAVRPELRPELKSITAAVVLPDYLKWPQLPARDIRGGRISVVRGSQATLVATASRPLQWATMDDEPSKISNDQIHSSSLIADESRRIEFQWRDVFGLEGKAPFSLSVDVQDDEPPALVVDGIPRQRVVLDSEQLTFELRADDDYGVKHVGLEWGAIPDEESSEPSDQPLGERILAAGGNEQQHLQARGTFSAQSLGIPPQPLQVRIFAEDYLPGRPRVYSPPYILLVLTPSQHALWLTEQLSRWHRQSLEVRDREMQLMQTNKQLRELTTEQLDQPEVRQQIQDQAAAERSNGRRLTGLVGAGEQLVLQATRNSEFGVGHLEKWAQMLQILQDISGNRMPSVADLLKQSSQAQKAGGNPSSKPAAQSRMVGNNRAPSRGSESTDKKSEKADEQVAKAAAVPQIQDVESSHLTAKKNENKENEESPSKSGAPALRLPITGLMASNSGESESCPVRKKLDEAVQEQENLLAEFDKIADQLNELLANLEGSTLVKRLKAASRHQYEIAGEIASDIRTSFGDQDAPYLSSQKVLADLSKKETLESQLISTIMDDMQGFYERRPMQRFRAVLDDMKKHEVVRAVHSISEDLKKQRGTSIAQCEFWSDNLDRWAEDLVDPASGGT